MNPSAHQHPVFVTITCLSLLAAWSTLDAVAADADAAATPSLAAAANDRPSLQIDPAAESDCLSRSGSQRALCIYMATRRAAVAERAAPARVESADSKPLRLAQRTRTRSG